MTNEERILLKEVAKNIKRQERINNEILKKSLDIDIKFQEGIKRLSLLL
ncbi:MAG: hypothetical protein Q8L27_02695 [archaeon]|nr:hypothetical protein [archaeon]